MNLFETIDKEIKMAMLAKDKIRLETLRSVKSAFLESVKAKDAKETFQKNR